MSLEEFEVRITVHAHEQYCNRVEQIGKDELQEMVAAQLAAGHDRRTSEFIQLQGVWWVFEVHSGVMIYITCYGRSSFDLPQALAWAARNSDRIVLSGSGVLCDGTFDG